MNTLNKISDTKLNKISAAEIKAQDLKWLEEEKARAAFNVERKIHNSYHVYLENRIKYLHEKVNFLTAQIEKETTYFTQRLFELEEKLGVRS